MNAIVVTAVQVPAHAKVGDLYGEVFTHQAVACSQVSMDKVQRGQVLHPRGDLSGHVAQVAVAAEGRNRVSEKKKKEQQHPLKTAIAEMQWLSPDSGGVAEQSELPLGLVAGQELVEVAVLHVLCDHAQGVAVDAHR